MKKLQADYGAQIHSSQDRMDDFEFIKRAKRLILGVRRRNPKSAPTASLCTLEHCS